MYHWASTGIVVPDFYDEQPKAWSYRDLVYLRLAAWLRVRRLHVADVRDKLATWREAFASTDDTLPTDVHSDGFGLSLGPMVEDELRRQPAFATMVDLTNRFDVLAPVPDASELGHERLRGPNLVHPSTRTVISPWVMSGEPCIADTRIPTSNLYALAERRRLDSADLARLYPGTSPEAIEDGIALERRLRTPARAA
jgi:uncharacterized protein (DUF433 family)